MHTSDRWMLVVILGVVIMQGSEGIPHLIAWAVTGYATFSMMWCMLRGERKANNVTVNVHSTQNAEDIAKVAARSIKDSLSRG